MDNKKQIGKLYLDVSNCGPELLCDMPSSHLEINVEKFKQVMLEALREWTGDNQITLEEEK